MTMMKQAIRTFEGMTFRRCGDQYVGADQDKGGRQTHADTVFNRLGDGQCRTEAQHQAKRRYLGPQPLEKLLSDRLSHRYSLPLFVEGFHVFVDLRFQAPVNGAHVRSRRAHRTRCDGRAADGVDTAAVTGDLDRLLDRCAFELLGKGRGLPWPSRPCRAFRHGWLRPRPGWCRFPGRCPP